MGYLIHSTGPWKEHKYIKKIGNRYYYQGENIPGESDNQTGKAKYSEYTKGDSDFNEEHYDEKNRLGNTDFYGYTKPDGTAVLLEEDMKWELPPGTKIDDALIKRLEEYWDAIGDYRDAGNTWTYADWEKGAEEVINGKSIKSIEDMDAMVKSNSRSLDEMAQAVIRGEFGNGKERKEALGENYAEVQKRVNEMLKEKKSSGKEISQTAINAMDKKLSYDYLIHSSGPWKKHKYIKKVGDRYYYTKGLEAEKNYAVAKRKADTSKKAYEQTKEFTYNPGGDYAFPYKLRKDLGYGAYAKSRSKYEENSKKLSVAEKELAKNNKYGNNSFSRTALKGINGASKIGEKIKDKAKDTKEQLGYMVDVGRTATKDVLSAAGETGIRTLEVGAGLALIGAESAGKFLSNLGSSSANTLSIVIKY